MLDDFNVNENAENMDEWVSDLHMVELSQKCPSKISEAMLIEVNLMLYVVLNDVNTDLSTETKSERSSWSPPDARWSWSILLRTKGMWLHVINVELSSVDGHTLTQNSSGFGQVTPTVPTPSPPLMQGHTLTRDCCTSSPDIPNSPAPGLYHPYAHLSVY